MVLLRRVAQKCPCLPGIYRSVVLCWKLPLTAALSIFSPPPSGFFLFPTLVDVLPLCSSHRCSPCITVSLAILPSRTTPSLSPKVFHLNNFGTVQLFPSHLDSVGSLPLSCPGHCLGCAMLLRPQESGHPRQRTQILPRSPTLQQNSLNLM